MKESETKDVFVRCVSKTGQQHMRNGVDCEDVCISVDKNGFGFYGLADGQSGKSLCRLGGERVLRAMAQFVEERTVQALIQCEYMDEIQYELIRVVRETISQLCREYGTEAANFASTIVAVAIDFRAKAYLSIHLGDGAIIGVKRNEAPVLLSAPENGITHQYTWLTTSPNAMQHLRVQKGSIKHRNRLVLLTDGATMLCRGRNIAKKAEAVLSDLDRQTGIEEVIQNSDPQDDATCIVIDFHLPE